jgi:hypothetical protein
MALSRSQMTNHEVKTGGIAHIILNFEVENGLVMVL